MNAERVFELLDGPKLFACGRPWHVEVFSVFDDAKHRWVQLSLDGPEHYMLTLCLQPQASSQSALSALESWLRRPDDPSAGWSDAILNVTTFDAMAVLTAN